MESFLKFQTKRTFKSENLIKTFMEFHDQFVQSPLKYCLFWFTPLEDFLIIFQ